MPPKLTGPEARALQKLLEGEFTFYGLISALPELSAPLRRWTYRRLVGHQRQQVSSHAVDEVPHGHDALVLQALLVLHLRAPVPERWVSCTGDELREVTSTLHPGLVLEGWRVGRALDRLVNTSVTLARKWREGEMLHSNEATFGFLTWLEVEGEVDDRGQHPATVEAQLSSGVLQLYRTGSPWEMENVQEAGLTA